MSTSRWLSSSYSEHKSTQNHQLIFHFERMKSSRFVIFLFLFSLYPCLILAKDYQFLNERMKSLTLYLVKDITSKLCVDCFGVGSPFFNDQLLFLMFFFFFLSNILEKYPMDVNMFDWREDCWKDTNDSRRMSSSTTFLSKIHCTITRLKNMIEMSYLMLNKHKV